MSSRILIALGIIAAVLVSVVVLTPSAQAADFRGGNRVVVAVGEVINDDMYITAEEIVIDGVVNGDVYALGSNVIINGTVQHDVNALAQTLRINGTVGDTLRGGAQAVLLGENAKIARSALLGGYSIETRPGSTIGGDMLFGGYQALLAGDISKDVLAYGNGIELTGNVGRNVRVSVGSDDNSGFSPSMFMNMRTNAAIPVPDVPAGLTVASTAKIAGDLIYEGARTARLAPEAQVTGPVVQQTPVPTMQERTEPVSAAAVQAQQTQSFVNGLLDQGRRFLVLLLLGLIALWLLPRWIQSLATNIRTKPLGSLGRGVLMFIGFIGVLIGLVVVVVMLALFFGLITLGSLAGIVLVVGTFMLGALTVGYWLFTSYIAPIVVSFLIGRAIFDRMQGSWAQNRFLAFFVGLVLLSLVALIPIVNFIVGVLVILFALGALLLWLAPRFDRTGPAAVQPALA